MGLIGTIAFASVAQTPTTLPLQAEELQTIGHNSLVAPRMPLYDTKMASLAVLTAEWDKDEIQQVFRETGQNREIIDCIIFYESKRNEKAYNPKDTDGREKFGLLQYGKEEFIDWCVNKYGFQNEILNGEIQKQCFLLMIKDGQLWRWPTASKCIK